MDALWFFLDQHARSHAGDVGGGSPASFSERVFGGLDVVAGAQVLDDGWLRRLAIERLDLDALAGYRSAVGWRTREVVRSLAASSWDEGIVEVDTARAAAAGAFSAGAEWVPGFWRKQTRSTRLGAVCTHNAMHVGEAATVRGLAGEGKGL